jgi:5,6-dimethylbenzimidazole synthase
MGWVSIFDPEALARLLGIPPGGRPIAILCLGHVDEFYACPMLGQEGWAERRPLEALVSENGWPEEK